MTPQHQIVRVTHMFSASPESVFDAWLDPHLLAQWMFDPGLDVQAIREISLNATVGGHFNFRVLRGDEEVSYNGTFREIVRPSRLVFTWITARKRETLVTVTVEPSGDGTRLSLVHELGTVPAQSADVVEAQWKAEFTSLSTLLH